MTEILRTYDLVITTYHHLAEISEAIKARGEPPSKVVGIETRPTPETMLRVARLPGTRIGVICTIQNSAHMLKHIFFGYHPEWEIEATAMDDQEEVLRIARQSEHLIVSHTSAAEFTERTGRIPDVVVNFQIDEQSVVYLRQRIYEIQMAKLSHADISQK